MEIYSSEVRWQQWPILWTTTTNPSVRELLVQVLRHVSTEVWGAPSRWSTSVIVFCDVQYTSMSLMYYVLLNIRYL
jgi:hypothetical protein